MFVVFVVLLVHSIVFFVSLSNRLVLFCINFTDNLSFFTMFFTVPSGVDLLASLATKSLDQEQEEEDYDEQEDEDVFTSEMLRLPQHKRIRRHSIAY